MLAMGSRFKTLSPFLRVFFWRDFLFENYFGQYFFWWNFFQKKFSQKKILAKIGLLWGQDSKQYPHFYEYFFGENFCSRFFCDYFFGENFLARIFVRDFFDGYFLEEFFPKKILEIIGWLVSLRTTYKAHSSIIKDFS